MKFVSVRELSRNPSKFIELDEPVVITKRGRPVKALITVPETEIEDFIGALPGDPIKKAEEFGIDLTLLHENLKKSPTDRLREAASLHRSAEKMRGAALRKS